MCSSWEGRMGGNEDVSGDSSVMKCEECDSNVVKVFVPFLFSSKWKKRKQEKNWEDMTEKERKKTSGL